MPLELPYFKFVATTWLTGNISFEDYETQGLFISICALYWQRSGKVSVDDLYKRYKKSPRLDSLLSGYVSVSDGFISVKFLDEQLAELEYISSVNAANGKLGGRPRTRASPDKKSEKKRPVSETKAKLSHIDIEVDKDIEVEIKSKGFSEMFVRKWLEWKKFKWDQFRFKFKNISSEAVAITTLCNMAETEGRAIGIINQSIANGWKGLFELKNNQNANTNQTSGGKRGSKAATTADLTEYVNG